MYDRHTNKQTAILVCRTSGSVGALRQVHVFQFQEWQSEEGSRHALAPTEIVTTCAARGYVYICDGLNAFLLGR